MKYYANYDKNKKLLGIGTGTGQVEISKEEYDLLLAEILEKVRLVEQVYNGTITIEDVPEEWREEIQRRVNEKKEYDKIKYDISDSNAISIITGEVQP